MLATAELRKKHMELNILWDLREYELNRKSDFQNLLFRFEYLEI